MDFNKINLDNEIIFILKNEVIDNFLTKKIISQIDKNCHVGLDMTRVRHIKSQYFIKCLIKNKFKLYNLQNEVLTYLALVLKDNSLKSFMNLSDFRENKRELVKRRFRIA